MEERTDPADDVTTGTGQPTGTTEQPRTGSRLGPAPRPDPGRLHTALGCLTAPVAGVTGFVTWLRGATPGVRGAFEGERDLTLLYLELPLLLFGFPLLALAAWSLTDAVLRRDRRTTPATRTTVPALAATVVLALLTWAATAWLDLRVAPFTHPD
ncbi:hypothetical protein [Streptomyces griseoaurantiacus]|uniref:hypothetical protein n=1 Tax=Streptomyces griseoaurantiacus TaxID=68213 RepID=UPI0032541D35